MKEGTNNGRITVAQLLTGARADDGLTRPEAARLSGVPERYIAFLEGGSPDGVSADVFTRNKLVEYSRFLGFDPEAMVAAYRNENRSRSIGETESPRRPRRHPLRGISSFRLLATSNVIRTSLACLAVVAIGIFFAFKSYRMVAPPKLVLTFPAQDGLVVTDKTLTVQGRTEREALLLINGKLVATDDDGNFSDRMDLKDGLNVVTVTSARKHGKSTELTRRVVVDPKKRPTATLNPTTER
ncbi:MAG: helix-turn-helix domain-containing protein [bacterium]